MIRLVAIICFYFGIDALFYWLNRKAKRIITFHNVLPKELWRTNLANGVSHSLEDFKSIIEVISRRFRFSTDVFDVKTVTITFDDGYHNQYEYAFKTLRMMKIPGIVFVSGDVVGEAGKGLVIDRLLHWVSCVPIDLISGRDRRCYWAQEVWPKFMGDGEASGRAVMDELELIYPYEKIEKQLGMAYRRERLSGISDKEKEEMRQAGWLVGWHAKSHYPLSRLSKTQVRAELEGPKEFRNVCLSFPYGNPVEVDMESIKVAEELGYPCALSNTNTSRLNATSRFFLPRMSIERANRYEVEFVLSGAKYFLKHRRLLP